MVIGALKNTLAYDQQNHLCTNKSMARSNPFEFCAPVLYSRRAFVISSAARDPYRLRRYAPLRFSLSGV